MKIIKELFGESSDISIMRLMSFISLMVGAILAISGHDTSVEVFVFAAFGGKALQRFAESREQVQPTTSSAKKKK